jgi:hypothetical protein
LNILVCLSALALSAIIALPPAPANEFNQHFLKCAKECNACSVHCNQRFKHSLEQAASRKSEHAKVGDLCANCAEICKAYSVLCSREWAHLAWIIECCANYCEFCEKECRQMLGDRTMDACAKECRQMAIKTTKARWPQGCFLP